MAHLDALRGAAVVFMIVLHTAESWLRPGLQTGLGWGWIRHFGGQAAPLFLILAGVGASLSWARGPARPGAQQAAFARGLELVLAGYALRLAMWWVDHGAVARVSGLTAGPLLGIGYWAIFRGLSALQVQNPTGLRAARWLGGGLGIATVALLWMRTLEPVALRSLLRQDVLQTIGASLALIALLEPWLRRHSALGVLLAVAVTLSTTFISKLLPGALPAAVAGYLAPWENVPGGPLPGRFPLLPWFAHALLGTAVGKVWGEAARRDRAREAVLETAVLGAALGFVLCEWWPSLLGLLRDAPWLVPSVRIGYRFGLGLVLAAGCLLLARGPGHRHWVALGQASLVIYCVHLEPAFGLMAKPVRRSLDYAQWAALALLLTVLMTGLAHLWVRRKQRSQALAGRSAAIPTREPR